MKNKNVIIDTNIIVSVLLTKNSESSTYKVLELVFNKTIKPFISPKIFSEYKEVLSREKFALNQKLVIEFLNEYKKLSKMINTISSDIKLIDEKDRPFYDLFISQNNNTFLITGNIKHFPKNDYILTAKDFLNLF